MVNNIVFYHIYIYSHNQRWFTICGIDSCTKGTFCVFYAGQQVSRLKDPKQTWIIIGWFPSNWKMELLWFLPFIHLIFSRHPDAKSDLNRCALLGMMRIPTVRQYLWYHKCQCLISSNCSCGKCLDYSILFHLFVILAISIWSPYRMFFSSHGFKSWCISSSGHSGNLPGKYDASRAYRPVPGAIPKWFCCQDDKHANQRLPRVATVLSTW